MSVIRYTAGGGYDPTNSQDITPDDDGRPFESLTADGHRFVAGDGMTDFALPAKPAEDGLYADFSDNITGATMAGGAAADVLIGGSGLDSLRGGAGDDVLEGGPGGDLLDGGAGFDTVSYAHARGAVSLDPGSPDVDSGDAAGDAFADIQAFRMSAHGDSIIVEEGRYTIEGGGGGDYIDAEQGAFVTASYAHSRAGVAIDLAAADPDGEVAGHGGDAQGDVLFGVVGLVGSQHRDRLGGDAHDNSIAGGGGADRLSGGGGADLFVFTRVSDFGVDRLDAILDFSGSGGDGDRIDLTRIAAFRFIGSHAFHGEGAAEIRIAAQADGYRVTGDVDGDGKADFALRVVSAAPLTARDFVGASAAPPPHAEMAALHSGRFGPSDMPHHLALA